MTVEYKDGMYHLTADEDEMAYIKKHIKDDALIAECKISQLQRTVDHHYDMMKAIVKAEEVRDED